MTARVGMVGQGVQTGGFALRFPIRHSPSACAATLSRVLGRLCLLTVMTAVTPMLTACWDPEPETFHIVNETGQTVTVSGGGGKRPVLHDDESTRYATNRCNSADLVAVGADGTEAARVTEEWCANGSWHIRADGESRFDPGSD
jgi:hypothetical protein